MFGAYGTQLNKQKEEHKKLLGLLSKEKEKVQEEQEEKEQLAREKEQAQHKYIQAQDALEKVRRFHCLHKHLKSSIRTPSNTVLFEQVPKLE